MHLPELYSQVEKQGSETGPLKLSFPDDDEDWRWPAIWRDTLKGLGHPVDVNLYSAQGEQYGAAFVADSIDNVTKQRSYPTRPTI